MKKTLIAIMALAGMATAADEFTGFTFSNTGTGDGLSSMLGFAFTLKATSTDYSVTNTTEFDFPKVLTLTEVSFNSAFVFNKDSKYGNIDSKNVYLYITDKDNAILGISEAASVVASTNSSNAGDAVTFTLDCANIKAGTEYYAWFMGTDSSYTTATGSDVKTISFTSGTTNNTVELRSYNKLVATTTGDLKLLTATDKTSSNYTFAGMTIKAVPEPTTATLSLLALAGLAARRRRK